MNKSQAKYQNGELSSIENLLSQSTQNLNFILTETNLFKPEEIGTL